jgi:hypothetical protein
MRIATAALLALLLLAAGCGRGSKPEGQAQETAGAIRVRWAEDLKLARIEDMNARLHLAFEDEFSVTKDHRPVVVKNCADYLGMESSFDPPDEQTARVLKSAGIDCLALQALASARPSRSTFLAAFKLDEKSVAVLPPLLGAVVSADDQKRVQAAESEGKSWLAFAPGLKTSADSAGGGGLDGSLAVRLPGWELHLKEYARGDFDGDGIEDVLVRDEIAGTTGTYADVRLFLLTRTSAGAVLRVAKQYGQ